MKLKWKMEFVFSQIRTKREPRADAATDINSIGKLSYFVHGFFFFGGSWMNPIQVQMRNLILNSLRR